MRRRDLLCSVGGAAIGLSLPRAGSAQQPQRLPKIGVLWHADSAEGEGANYQGLVDGFRALGYVDGKTISLLHRFPNEDPEKFRSMAAELVASGISVLIAIGANAAPYAKSATKAIPVVFALVSDPIGSNLVESLARPEANVTGLSNSARDIIGKRLELLKEMIPGLSRVALLVNSTAKVAVGYDETFQKSTMALGLAGRVLGWRSPDELVPVFNAMKTDHMQAIVIAPDGLGFTHRDTIAKLAVAHQLGLSGWSRDILKSGALMTYGADQQAICFRTAVFVDKLLKGAKPGDLPVEQPAKFELLINLRTAKAIGLTIPPAILTRADDVIE